MEQEQAGGSDTRRRVLIALAVFALGMALTLYAYARHSRAEELEQRMSHQLLGAQQHEQLRYWLDIYLAWNKGLAAFFSASNHVSPSEFDNYLKVADPFSQLAGISAVGYVQQVHIASTDTFRYPLAVFSELSGVDTGVPHYTQNLAKVGLLGEAIRGALQRGEAVAAPLMGRTAEGGERQRLLVFTPVYKPQAVDAGESDPVDAIEGLVFSVLDLQRFMVRFRASDVQHQLSMRLYLNGLAPASLWYADTPDTDVSERSPVYSSQLPFAGNTLLLEFRPLDSRAGLQSSGTLWILGFGSALSVLLAWVAVRVYRHYALLSSRSSLAQQFTSFFMNHPFAVYSLDRQRRFIAVNSRMAAEMGAAAEDLVGVPADSFLTPENAKLSHQYFQQALKGQAVAFSNRIRRTDGHEFDISAVFIPILLDGEVASVLCIAENITERKRQEERLYRQAHFDSLTGTPNRAHFYECLEQALRALETEGVPLALMYLDIDRFKQINDTYGHHVGDAVIRELAMRIRGAVRTTDTLARLGGDEFVLVIRGCDNPQTLRAIAGKLLACMASPFTIEGLPLPVSVSIGVACAQPGMTLDDLMRAADQAMYRAKRAGGARFDSCSLQAGAEHAAE